jgi:hypothetical protein
MKGAAMGHITAQRRSKTRGRSIGCGSPICNWIFKQAPAHIFTLLSLHSPLSG